MIKVKGYEPFEDQFKKAYAEYDKRNKAYTSIMYGLLIFTTIVFILMIATFILPFNPNPAIFTFFIICLTISVCWVFFYGIWSAFHFPTRPPIVSLYKMLSSVEDKSIGADIICDTAGTIFVYDVYMTHDGHPDIEYVRCSKIEDTPNDTEYTIAFPDDNGKIILSLNKTDFSEIYGKITKNNG